MAIIRVSGTSYYQPAVMKAADAYEHCRFAANAPMRRVQLCRDRKNKYDSNAVAIKYGGEIIGYVPRDISSSVASVFDRGEYLCGRIKSCGRAFGTNFMGCQIEIWRGDEWIVCAMINGQKKIVVAQDEYDAEGYFKEIKATGFPCYIARNGKLMKKSNC